MNNLEKLSTIMADQLGIEDSVISEDTTLEDLGADSLALVELVMSVEEEFDIQIDDEDMEKFKTVGDVLDYIESK